MKFKRHEKKDSRVKRRFLLFPKTIGAETRWLEFAEWIETYEGKGRWIPEQWFNKTSWVDN